jgi:hypothetical protein
MRNGIAQVEERASEIVDALERGVLPFTVEQASFDADLADLRTGVAVKWSIRGTLLGSPVTVERSIDFSNLVAAASELLQGLIG